MVKLLIGVLLASHCYAQTITGRFAVSGGITVGVPSGIPGPSGPVTLSGLRTGSVLDYYTAHPILAGDTNYPIQTAVTYANGASAGTSTLNLNDGSGNRSISGTILSTFNDGRLSGSPSSIGIYRIPVLDMSSAANTTTVAVNSMTSYGSSGNEPVGWNGQCTGTGPARVCDWKTGKPISVGGWTVLPLQRQETNPYYATGDSTLIATPDGGAHWCNVRTFLLRSGGVGCDATAGWKTDGDAPLPPSDASYTGSPSTFMWKEPSPYDGTSNSMGRLSFFDYCQANACSGSPHGADTYLYGWGSNGRATKYILFRVPKNINSIMDVTAYQYYVCANYSPTNVCDGAGSTWTSTLASATMIFTGVGAALNGGGQSTNPVPNGYTNQYGIVYGNPIYYCANSGCAYIAMTAQVHLANGNVRNNMMAFTAPWGPFTPPDREFSNPIFGYFNFLRYTIVTPDSTPYHARFIMAGGNTSVQTSEGSVFFQAYDVTVSPAQYSTSLTGCTPFRFDPGPVTGAIVSAGLWGFFDFFSHGCENNTTGNIYYEGLYANDLATYPTSKQLVGCFTDAGDKCGNPNTGDKGLFYTPDGIYIANSGYSTRFEIRDQVPGVYNTVTSSPLTTSTDPAWTASFAVKPNGIATLYQGMLQVGPANHQLYIFNSYLNPGVIGVSWLYPSGATNTTVRTSAAQLVDGTWSYMTVTRTAGPITVCTAVPCTATVHFYRNGIEVAAQGVSGGGADLPSMATGTHIVGTSLGNNSFVGTWGGLEIYGRALSESEIRGNYTVQQTGLALRGIALPTEPWQTASITPTISVTNTQAVLAYNAPPASPACTVDISESASYSPKVHDVDIALFGATANQDDRASGLTSGVSRIFVAGKRSVESGTGGYYSRALQANTLHYWRVTCGAAVGTGSFITANIPIGNTANEMPQIDVATGLAVNPTFPQDRTTTVIDPFTGIQAKRATLTGDTSDNGASYLYSGGRRTMCGHQLTGPSSAGYLCKFPTITGGPSAVYYYLPATGEMRFLGQILIYSGFIDPSDPLSIIDGVSGPDNGTAYTQIRKHTYTGDFTEQAPDTVLPVTTTNLTPGNSWAAMITAYDATLTAIGSNCSYVVIGGTYAVANCRRGIQDSYGFMLALNMGNKLPLGSGGTMSIVGAIKIWEHPETRWCGTHSVDIVPTTGLVTMLTHGMNSGVASPGANVGLGPYETTLTTGVNSSITTFQVAGEPLSKYDLTVENYLMDAAVGDQFRIGGPNGTERVLLTGKAGTTWTVTRGYGGTTAASASAGAIIFAECGNATGAQWYDHWWDFVADPTGSTAAGYLRETYLWGGHEDSMAGGRVAERSGTIGSLMAARNSGGVALTFEMSTNPTFAGVVGYANGNTYSDYPSYHQVNAPAADQNWYVDEPEFFGALQLGPGATLVSDQLYKYVYGVDWTTELHRKQLTTIAASGKRMATDISSPATGNVIGTGIPDNFKYCVANAINECRTGSAIGDAYINMPGVVFTSCTGAEGPNVNELCVTDLALGQGAYQFGTTANTVARPPGFTGVGAGFTRKLSYGFGGVKLLNRLIKTTPDGKWAFLSTQNPTTGAIENTYMVKMPPMPTTIDPINRSTFVRVPVSIATPVGLGITTATVEFGYAEFGTPDQYYCTSRRETCLVVASTVTDATPFSFKATDVYTKAPCVASCTIAIPLMPMHVGFFRVSYYNAGGAFVQYGISGVAREGGVSTLQ